MRTSPRQRSPIGALLVTGAVSLAALLAFSFEPTAVRALTFIIQYRAYLVLGVYLLTVIAALVMVWRGARRAIPVVILAVGSGCSAMCSTPRFRRCSPVRSGLSRWLRSGARSSASRSR